MRGTRLISGAAKKKKSGKVSAVPRLGRPLVLPLSIRASQSDQPNRIVVIRNIGLVIHINCYIKLIWRLNS